MSKDTSAPRFRSAAIRIATTGGAATVPAVVWRGIAVHGARGQWTITHVNTGCAMLRVRANKSVAIDIASRIAEAADWGSARSLADVARLPGSAKRLVVVFGLANDWLPDGPRATDAAVRRAMALDADEVTR